jgi:hypothetical protein
MYMVVPGLPALPFALVCSVLYFGLVFSLERMLAASISAFWPAQVKIRAFSVRFLIGLLTSCTQAAPVILLALGTQIDARLAKFEQQERDQARAHLEQLHGIRGVEQKSADIQKALTQAGERVWLIPEAVTDLRQLAQACDAAADTLLATNRRKAASLQARIPVLANVLSSPTSSVAQRDAATRERESIDRRVNVLADEVATKRGECRAAHARAEDALKSYQADATVQREKLAADLAQQKRLQAEAATALQADVARADKLARRTNESNSAAEVKAAVALISEEPYARLKAAWIWLMFLVIDIAGASLKLLSRPGPYDFALRTRDGVSELSADEALRGAEIETRARLAGKSKFYSENATELFAVEHQRKLQEEASLREAAAAIRLASYQAAELITLADAVERARNRLKGHPELTLQLDRILAMLRPAPGHGVA